ncbi:MAG: hypothetical protein KDK70_40495 [Myxococcales bacterium]|nr:hypothetical protein [Myxococcales bacterium]
MVFGVLGCSVGGSSGGYGGFPGVASSVGDDGDGDTSDDPPGESDASTGGAGEGSTGGSSATGPSTAGSTTHITVGSDGDGSDDDGEHWDLGQLPDIEPPAECGDDVDVVFVMDVSTSMGPFLDTLADEILVVDAVLQGFDLPSDPHYGLVVFVDDYLVLGGGAPYPSANALRNDFITWSNFTASNQQIGGGGNFNTTWPENSMDALWAASQLFAWRPAATTTRVIIHTTDDTFWNGPTVGNAVPITHGWTNTQSALQSEEIRVYSFAAEIGGQCECLDVSMGWFGPYQGHPSMADGTNGGIFDIDQVLSGAISLSEAISGAVAESICDPYEF